MKKRRFCYHWLGVLLTISYISLLVTPTPAFAQSDITCTNVVVEPGDTLSKLANQYYGNMAAYNRILEATNAKAAVDSSYATIASANTLAVGWKLCIPSATEIQAPQSSASTAAAFSQSASAAFDPLSIPSIRTQTFAGSPITLEQTLANRSTYRQYLASYQSEGLKIYALLTIPRGQQPANGWPVIVFNHGYSDPALYQSNQGYMEYVDAFARSGYIVFRPDYRGYGRSDGERLDGIDVPDYTIDVLNAVGAIKQFPGADPERIGMWGHSLGGYITLRVMVVSKDIKAGVIWAGVVGSYTDVLAQWGAFSTLLPTAIQAWFTGMVATHGSPIQNPTYWDSTSANNYLADLSGPLQLHHSSTDPSVPAEFSDSLYQQLQTAGKPAQYYRYAGDDHNISNNFPLAMQRSVAFFDKYLKS